MQELREENKSLKKFYEEHKHCSKVLVKDGSGNCNCRAQEECTTEPENESNLCPPNDPCSQPDNVVNPDLNQVIPQEEPKVSNHTEQEKTEHITIPHDLIIKRLWKRHQFKCMQLLKKLEDIDSFKIDKLSMVYIDEVPLHISIFELMNKSFKPTKDVGNLNLYKNLLSEYNLTNYITNKYLLVEEQKPIDWKYWYFIG